MVPNEGADRRELVEPWRAVVAAAGEPLLVAPDADDVLLLDHLDSRTCWAADLATRELQVADVDALVVCGDRSGADRLRADPPAIGLVRAAVERGCPVAAMCLAPLALIGADVLADRTVTSSAALRADLEGAGAAWVDAPVHACTRGPNTLVTCRGQADLGAYCETLVRVVAGRGTGPPAAVRRRPAGPRPRG